MPLRAQRRSAGTPVSTADGTTTVQFVRPAHGLLALHGTEVVGVGALGLKAGRATTGHRFQGAKRIELARADDYERALADGQCAAGDVPISFAHF